MSFGARDGDLSYGRWPPIRSLSPVSGKRCTLKSEWRVSGGVTVK
jgi:hypothetical protein